MRHWAERHGHVVVREFVEPGASATDDKRPIFQEMMQAAEQKPAAFQMIVVHSLSRFFRDLVEGAMYQRKLIKLGIRLESITQQTSSDPSGDMQRHMIMLFDEYQSKEISKHTLSDNVRRSIKHKLEKGEWIAIAPLGYSNSTDPATGRSQIVIDPQRAPLVKQLFNDYASGVYSMAELARKTKAWGLTSRKTNRPLNIQTVAGILSNPFYCGMMRIKGKLYPQGQGTDPWSCDHNPVEKRGNVREF